ncbi:hypothetical protein HHI36_021269 [Cryptolaemus montrouzieri]|uniref:C2H2-type domain-containing protein n=1 Tax=Cryptolaemus montrouzieri TaxID=559131 RepID=A0ABD2MWE2_9CUCU
MNHAKHADGTKLEKSGPESHEIIIKVEEIKTEPVESYDDVLIHSNRIEILEFEEQKPPETIFFKTDIYHEEENFVSEIKSEVTDVETNGCTLKYESPLEVKEGGILKPTGFICSCCDYSAPSLQDLACHEKSIHHEPRWFPCKICTKVLKSTTSFKTHVNKHISKEFTKCHRCSFVATTVLRLRAHFRKEHSTEPHINYKCQFCSMVFITRVLQDDHEYLVHHKGKKRVDEIKTSRKRKMYPRYVR